MNDILYVSIDGNNIGRELERLMLGERLEELKIFSETMLQTISKIVRHVEEIGGEVIMAGGDNVLARMSESNANELSRWVAKLKTDKISFSVGIGNNVKMAYLALKYAKVNGIDSFKECVAIANGGRNASS